MTSEVAAYYSIFFDVGGILGGILAGIATDLTGKSASTCAVMLITAIPMVKFSVSLISFLSKPYMLLQVNNNNNSSVLQVRFITSITSLMSTSKFCLFFQLFAYNSFGHSCPLDVSTHNSCYWGNIAFLIATGLLVSIHKSYSILVN